MSLNIETQLLLELCVLHKQMIFKLISSQIQNSKSQRKRALLRHGLELTQKYCFSDIVQKFTRLGNRENREEAKLLLL